MELEKPIEGYDEDLSVNTEIIVDFEPEMILEIIQNFCETKGADDEV